MEGLKKRLQRALEQLDEQRAAVGLPPATQKEIAKASGLSQSVISDYLGKEALKRPLKESFTAATLARLCLALQADINFVLVGDGDVVPGLARRSVSSLIARGAPPTDMLREETAPVKPPPVVEPEARQGAPIQPPTPVRKAVKRAGRNPSIP